MNVAMRMEPKAVPVTDAMLVPELVANPAEFAERVVQPFQTVMRALRQDTVAQMYHRGQLGPVTRERDGQIVPRPGSEALVLLQAARQWQRDAEAAGPRIKSSGHLQEPVDGSRPPAEGITDRQMEAHRKLERYRRLLGPKYYAVIEAFLGEQMSMWAVVCRFYPEDQTPARRRFVGTLIRDLLMVLARDMGLASG